MRAVVVTVITLWTRSGSQSHGPASFDLLHWIYGDSGSLGFDREGMLFKYMEIPFLFIESRKRVLDWAIVLRISSRTQLTTKSSAQSSHTGWLTLLFRYPFSNVAWNGVETNTNLKKNRRKSLKEKKRESKGWYESWERISRSSKALKRERKPGTSYTDVEGLSWSGYPAELPLNQRIKQMHSWAKLSLVNGNWHDIFTMLPSSASSGFSLSLSHSDGGAPLPGGRLGWNLILFLQSKNRGSVELKEVWGFSWKLNARLLLRF